MEETAESSTHVNDEKEDAEMVDANEPVDLEDGELSDGDDDNENSTEDGPTTIDGSNESLSQTATTLTSSGTTITEELDTTPTREASVVEKRKHSESSDNNDNSNSQTGVEPPKHDDSSDSSSSSDGDRSDKKRKRKLEKRRKKEKKREKRKREKQKEREERKDRKRRKYHHDDYNRHDDMGYDNYSGYYDGGGGGSMTSPRHHRQQRGSYDRDYYYDQPTTSPPGPYDSPPPDESSEDEFSETLINMVQSELSDPNVSLSEREAFMRKSQKRIPGLTQAKLNKIMKKNRWNDMNSSRSRSSRRPPPRRMRDMRDEEPKQKCKFYAEGKCQKGDKCQYSHNFIPAKKMEACKFFLQGYCAKGDMCIYLHSEVPCKYFHTRQQCFNGDKCKFSHDALTDSTRPLLEKAILLEETGTFKPEKPSLLGSPPKDIIASYASRFSSNTDLDNQEKSLNPSFQEMSMENQRSEDANNMPIPSIFDLHLKPTADMREKLDAGLYEEITAPISDGDEDDQYGSPVKIPQSFYADTLSTQNKTPKGQVFSPDAAGSRSSGSQPRKNRWGPDLPVTQTEDNRLASGDAEHAKRGPLLPLPTPPTPFPNSSSQSNAQNTFSTPTTEANDLTSKAAVNLNKIISALRSTSQGAAIVKTADPRRTTAVVDPRVKSADPRSHDTNASQQLAADPRLNAAGDSRVSADPRQASKSLLPDPRPVEASNLVHDPRQNRNSTQSRHSPPQHTELPALNRPPPELNGVPTRPMNYHVRLVTIESKGVYIPAGADSSHEMLKDPRIRKRIEAMKQGERHAPPSLPDITADLDRMRNAMIMSAPTPVATTSNKQPAPNPIDPRRSSTEKPAISTSSKPINSNPAKMTLSRIQQTLALHQNAKNRASSVSADDEEDGNSLTIDVPDESRNGASNIAASCS